MFSCLTFLKAASKDHSALLQTSYRDTAIFFTAAALNRLQLGIFNANCACCMYMFVKGAQMAFSVLPLYDMDVVGG